MRHVGILSVLLLTACQSTPGDQAERLVPDRPITAIVADTITGTFQGALAAVASPFEDIGLRKQAIPQPLQELSDNPYALPRKMRCAGIRKEIAELDQLLGPDIRIADKSTGQIIVSRKGEYVEEGANFARDQTISMVNSKTSIIPFRGVVRNISGAEKHSKALAHAYEAGKLRRAFLKGVASAMGSHCLTDPATQQAAL